jgi:ATP-dependent Clp protease ATP-binding subunit ClpA
MAHRIIGRDEELAQVDEFLQAAGGGFAALILDGEAGIGKTAVWLEMRAAIWRDGLLIAEEERVLQMTVYFTNELMLMLKGAGFEDVVVRGDYTDSEPTNDTRFVVFMARKPR